MEKTKNVNNYISWKINIYFVIDVYIIYMCVYFCRNISISNTTKYTHPDIDLKLNIFNDNKDID